MGAAWKVLRWAAVIIILLYFLVIPQCVRYFESQTRAELLDLVARELPAKASLPEMKSFLARHAEAIDVREFRSDEVIGVMPKTRLDSWLMNRQVQIVLKVDSSDRFTTPEIRMYYTFL